MDRDKQSNKSETNRERLSNNYKEIRVKFPNVKFISQYLYDKKEKNYVRGLRLSLWAKSNDEFLNVKNMIQNNMQPCKVLESGPIYKINNNGQRSDQELYFLKINLFNLRGEQVDGRS